MNWLTLAQIPAPQPPPASATLADFMLAYAVYEDIKGASDYFLGNGKMGPQYANPQAYLANMIQYAISLTQNKFEQPYAPAGWSPMMAAMNAVTFCFAMLAQLPVNASDPNTVSILTAWENGTGMLYGGHAPVATPPQFNPGTGQGSAPANSIL